MIRVWKFLALYKIDELKPISHKEFNQFMKGKGFKGRKNYVLKDLKAKFGFKPWLKGEHYWCLQMT